MAGASKERLHQIAERKLAGLGVRVDRRQVGEDDELHGVLMLSTRVLGAAQSGPLLRAAFVVVDHDKLAFRDPPFHLAGTVVFYDCETTAALESRIRQKLDERAAAAATGERKLRALGLDARIDPERLVAVVVVSVGASRVELEADPTGVRVARIHSGRHVLAVPAEGAGLRLEQFRSRIDLELYIGAQFSLWEQAAFAVMKEQELSKKKATQHLPAMSFAPDVAARLHAVAASSEVPSLGALVDLLGPLAVPNRLEVVQDFVLGAQRYRFIATHEAGTRFRGVLFDAAEMGKRPLWDDAFDVTRIHGLSEIVTYVLGLAAAVPADGSSSSPPQARDEAPPMDEGSIPEHLIPHPGEVWVMNVRVESDDGRSVSYVTIDVDGRSWGGVRTLERGEFDALFPGGPGGHRMSVVVEDVRAPDVLYRQLDPQGVPIGDVRRLPIAQLVATFQPAASLY